MDRRRAWRARWPERWPCRRRGRPRAGATSRSLLPCGWIVYRTVLTYAHARFVTFVVLLLASMPCAAQTAQPSTPQTSSAPDTPTVKVGGTIFTDYRYQQQPKVTDSDGNLVNLSQFEITRAYVNLTGNLSRRIAFRLTTDVARETGVGSALEGSYTLRLKFAYGQWNLDDWLGKDAYTRFGIQPTPWIYFMDDIYRYRFQGQEFEERDGFLTF